MHVLYWSKPQAYHFCLQANGAAASSKAKSKAAAKSDSGTHTIDLQETFYARPQDIYECFTQAGKIQAFTQSPAQAQPNVGGSFSMFGGSVQGTYKELVPFSRLRLDWRFANWPDDATSKVRGQSVCTVSCSIAFWLESTSRIAQCALARLCGTCQCVSAPEYLSSQHQHHTWSALSTENSVSSSCRCVLCFKHVMQMCIA